MELRDRTALVTGASGFVGAYVARRLLAEGMRVRALVRSAAAATELQALGVETQLGELTDAAAPDFAEARSVNVAATSGLAEAARAAGCERFVHISTIAVHPLRDRDAAVAEDAPRVTDGDAYSVTKAEAEQALRAVAARGLRTVILRPVVILGVHPTSTWGTNVPAQIEAGQFVHVDGGETRLGYVHIKNLVDAVARSLRTDDPAVIGEAFTICDGHARWIDYTRRFSAGPLPELPPDQAPGFLAFRGSYATDKAQRLLGFTPRPDFDAYMDEIVRARRPAG